jgi:peptidoglycan/xylan/chitin deacetylase (PgdA/CDA1 family)
MRQLVKRFAELALCRSGVTRWSRGRRANSLLILAYHNIVPHGEETVGDQGLHLPQREFAQQLDLLCRTHDVISLESVLDPSPSAGRPRAAITFDDACQGAVTAGVQELTRRGLPATIFIAPAFVGGSPFWWDALAQPDASGLSDHVRQFALTGLEGRDDRIRAWADTQGWSLQSVPWHQTCATEQQLRGIATNCITFGSHTWSHPNLTALAEAELRLELTRPLEWLHGRFSNVLDWLAYPYGLHTPAVAHQAGIVGYTGGLLIEGGWVNRVHGHDPRLMLPRQNIPAGLSLQGFELRVSGVRGS